MADQQVGSGEATKHRSASFSTVVVNNATPVLICSASENRVALTLTPNSLAEVQYSPNPTNGGHQSINLPSAASPIILKYEDVGDIVKKAWYAVLTAAGPTTVGLIETFTD